VLELSGSKKTRNFILNSVKSYKKNSQHCKSTSSQDSARLVLALSVPYRSAQDGFKNQTKIFLELSDSKETKNLL
jgi:hypothetical protein